MIFFKSCPRCVGDQVSDDDEYGRYVTCLACGYVEYPPAEEAGSDQAPETSVALAFGLSIARDGVVESGTLGQPKVSLAATADQG